MRVQLALKDSICPKYLQHWYRCLFLGILIGTSAFAFQGSIAISADQTALSTNLIENGGFEMGTLAPFAQGVQNGSITLTTDPRKIYSGAYALMHQATGENSYSIPWNGSDRMTVQDDRAYRFSAWVRAEAPNTRVRIILFSLQNGQTTGPYYIGRQLVVGEEWQKIEVINYHPPGYDQLAYRIENRDQGTTVYWDNLRVAPVNNPFPNQGFEASKLPFTSTQKGSLGIVTDEAFKGTQSLRHQASSSDSYTLPYIGQAASLTTAKPGDVFKLSTYVKGQTASTPIQLRIFPLDANYQLIDIGLKSATTANNAANWKYVEMTHTMPAGTEYISIRLDNDGGKGAVVWWDNVILEHQIPDVAPRVSFMAPVQRTVRDGETVFLERTHQRGSNGWFGFEIPGNAVELQWVQTQGPVDIGLSTPAPTAGGFYFTGSAVYTQSLTNRATQQEDEEFTAEFQFKVDGQPLTFFVKGSFKFVSWDMRIRGADGFGFEINLEDFPTDHFFDLEITNFDFSESLIIPFFDFSVFEIEAPFGIDTIVNPVFEQDPDGIDPFGVIIVSPGATDVIEVRLSANFGAEAGNYLTQFEGRARNGGTESADLQGIFRRAGEDLSLDNIQVLAFPSTAVNNNGTYQLAEPLQASGDGLDFEIRNFNASNVFLEEASISTISAPSGSNLELVPSGSIRGVLDGNGGSAFLSGTLTYDEATAQNGNFLIDVSFLVTDTDGGITFGEFYSFTIAGAIGQEDPCSTAAKRGDPACEGTLLLTFPQLSGDDQLVDLVNPNDFGDVRKEYLDNTTFDTLVRVKNQSQASCTIQAPTISGQGYSILDNPFTTPLPPGESRDFTIRFNFQNLAPAAYQGDVSLTHDDGSVINFSILFTVKPTLGIRLVDGDGAMLKLSTPPDPIRDTFDFSPGEPIPVSVGRIFKIFTLQNTGTQTVIFKTSDAEIPTGDGGFEPFNFSNAGQPGEIPIQPGNSTSFGVELLTSDFNDPFLGIWNRVLNLPFEVQGSVPDQALLAFGLEAEIGRPPQLEIDVCEGTFCGPGVPTIPINATTVPTIAYSNNRTTFNYKMVNTGDQPISIDAPEDISISGEGFSLEPGNYTFGQPISTNPQEPNSFNIRFEAPPGSKPGDTFSGQVNIFTNPANANILFFLEAQLGDVELEKDAFLLPQGGSLEFNNNPQAPGGQVVEQVLVQNYGNTSLNGTLALTQVQGSAFSLAPGGTFANISVPPGGQQAFDVVLDRSNSGTFAAEIALDHNLPGPDPYVITVNGVIGGGTGGGGSYRVTHGATNIPHNSNFSFGQTPVGVEVGKNFLIWNESDTTLVIPRANFSVPNGYQLIETPAPIPPRDPDGTVHSDNFSFKLRATQAGQFNGALRFTNTSGHSPNPFTLNVEGTVGPQEPGPTDIRVTHGSTEVPHLSLFSFGTTPEGTFVGRNFRIWNETSEPLTFPRSLFMVPPGYQLIETPEGAIPPPDPDGTVHWDNFSVHLTANNPGTFNGQVSFVPVRPNNAQLPTYRMNVTGTVQQDAACISDATPPSLTITQPANNAVLLPGSITFAANASDSGSGVERVKFYVNNTVIKNDPTAPYSTPWNATEGSYTLKAEAFDHCGNSTVKTIQVTVEDPCSADTQGPQVGITNPTQGAALDPGLVNITVSASDPSGVDRVEFRINGSLIQTDTQAPWTHGHWFTSQGQQTIAVVAYDDCGNSSTASVTFTITRDGFPCEGDTILPWGTVTSPANGATLQPGTVVLSGTAGDNVNVLGVAFEVDGQVPGGNFDFAPPYNYSWNATPGTHTIRMRIADVCDNVGYSDPITVTVANPDPCSTDTTAPSVAITVPTNGVSVEPGLINITVAATDNAGGSGMDRVEFRVNGSLIQTDTAPPWTQGYWFTVQGTQTIHVTGYDQCGNSATDSVTFTVTESGAPCDGDTQPPVGAFTNPTPNSVIMPGPITLRANVTDNVNVFAVSFMVDGQVPEANVDLAPPYEYTWNATPGVHTLRLNMLDSCDNSGLSPEITITVLGSTPTTVPNFVGKINGQTINSAGTLVVNTTNPAINFTWDHASAAPGIERYHIVVQPIGGPWLYGPNPLYPATSHTLQTSGLVPGTSYSIHIRAKSNDGIWGNFVNGGNFTVQ